MIRSPIRLIARLLINCIAICMYSEMEHCSKSTLKIISNGLNERNLLGLHHLTSMIIIKLKPCFFVVVLQ